MPVQKAGCEALEYNNGTHLVKTGALVTINNEIENSAIRNVRFYLFKKLSFLFPCEHNEGIMKTKPK